MADNFTSQKLAAVDRVLLDTRAKHLDFRVFCYLASATDRETMVARRKQQTIADGLGVTKRAVQISIDRLHELGHLKLETKDGGTYVNAYRIVPKKTNADSPLNNGKANSDSSSRSKRRSNRPEKANETVQKGEPPFAPILPFKSHKIPSRGREPSGADALGSLGATIGARIGHDKLKAWFGKASIADVTADTVTIELPDGFLRDRVDSDFGDVVLKCCQELVPSIKRVHVAVEVVT
ncbi:hypothetical protein V1281_001776 [Nitrobacteraceae bacterium AZCC 2161]